MGGGECLRSVGRPGRGGAQAVGALRSRFPSFYPERLTQPLPRLQAPTKDSSSGQSRQVGRLTPQYANCRGPSHSPHMQVSMVWGLDSRRSLGSQLAATPHRKH